MRMGRWNPAGSLEDCVPPACPKPRANATTPPATGAGKGATIKLAAKGGGNLKGVIKGYKKRADGSTTSYFTREVDPATKALLGAIEKRELRALEDAIEQAAAAGHQGTVPDGRSWRTDELKAAQKLLPALRESYAFEQEGAQLRRRQIDNARKHRQKMGSYPVRDEALGKDRRGAGVMYQRMGMWDVPGIGRETGLDTYIAGLWFEVWWSWHLLYQESIAAGVALVGRLYVVDLAGMYLSRAMRNISYGKQITATFPGKEHPIPEGMSKCIVTNAPWYVERVWSALKYSGVIPARTLAKVSIFSDEAKFLAELSKHVDLHQVPSLFGGSSAAPWPFAEGGDVPNGAGVFEALALIPDSIELTLTE
mgnify:CR=1 FL=1